VDLALLTVSTVVTFLLIMFRVSGLLMAAPFFNSLGIPVQVKIGLAFILSILLFPLHSSHFVVPKDMIQFTIVGAQEIFLGLMLGFVSNLVFVAFQMAGDLLGMQLGLSSSSMLDPISGINVPTVGQIYFYFALLIFLSLNAHHLLILAVDHSFEVMPLGKFFDLNHGVGVLSERMLFLTGDMLTLALLIAAPVMGIMVVTEVALSFMSKVMPQMNVFMVAMPLKIVIGLSTIAVCLPYVNELLTQRLAGLYTHLKVLFNH